MAFGAVLGIGVPVMIRYDTHQYLLQHIFRMATLRRI
jgi:hypothetical protein